jgi:hypothetical protein
MILKAVSLKYVKDLSAPYVPAVHCQGTIKVPPLNAGTMHYNTNYSRKPATGILRSLPSNKAMGTDLVPDKWLRKGFNSAPIMAFVHDIVEGINKVPSEALQNKIMLLAKEETDCPHHK